MGTATTYLSPAKFLAPDLHPETLPNPPDLLILNQPIAHFDVFARLWKHTSYRVCADGGANRLFDMFEGTLAVHRDSYVGRSPRVRHDTDWHSCPILFTVTSILCATMFVRTMQHMASMCRKTMISIAQTSERIYRNFPREAPHRRRKTCSSSGLWQVELIRASDCYTK
jgi:hypothetical protein